MATLPVYVELLLGGQWQDVTNYVLLQNQIGISRGRSAQGSTTDPAQVALTLKNPAGRFSPRNPVGPYYGQLGRNTQLRVSVGKGSGWLGCPDDTSPDMRASTPNVTALQVVGDLDVRFDIAPLSWSDANVVELGGKWGASGNRSWQVLLVGGGLWMYWTATGSTVNTVLSTALISANPRTRMCVRAVLDVDNGASGNTVTFYKGPSMSGPWTQLGNPIVNSGVTSIYNSTAPVEIGDISTTSYANAACRIYSAQILSGIAGTVVASPDFTGPAAGTLSWTDSIGRVWTANSTSALTNRHIRGVVEISELPARWDVSGGDSRTPVTASGILRRMRQSATPLRSPMYRDTTQNTAAFAAVIGYWPMEDGSAATQIASGLPGGAPMRLSGAVSLSGYSAWAASDALPTLGTGGMVGAVPYATSTGEIVGRMFVGVPAGGVSATAPLWTIANTGGTALKWSVWIDATGAMAVRAYDSTGANILDSGFAAFAVNGQQCIVQLHLTNVGADVHWDLFIMYLTGSSLAGYNNAIINGTLTAQSVGRPTTTTVGEQGALSGVAVGHLIIANDDTPFATSNNAVLGWSGETAPARIARLCAEEGIPVALYTDPQDSGTLLGPQALDDVLTLLQAAADADGGVLFEQREMLGLAYRTRATGYNQPTALALDYQAPGLAPPLEPTDDDQAIKNDVTVSRTNGGSGRATLTTGPLSTQAPPNGVGRYRGNATLGLYSDDQAAQMAAWMLWLGTWDAARYEAVTVNLMRLTTTALLGAAADLDVWDQLALLHLPVWAAVSEVDLQIQGYTETLGSTTWDITYNCSPAGPWQMGILDDTVLGHADTDGSQLAAGVNATATTLSVAVTAGPLWTTNGADFPFDVTVAGEQMTVTNITGSSSPQSFTVTRSVNGVVKSQTINADLRLTHPMIVAL